MKVLLLGSGGREHALAWKIVQSPKLGKLYVAPGNAGTAQLAENVSLAVTDFRAIGDFIQDKQIDLLVVGPEDPLVEGIRDFLEADSRFGGLMIVGPGKDGAILEGSKDFCQTIYDPAWYSYCGIYDGDSRSGEGRTAVFSYSSSALCTESRWVGCR